LKTAPLRSILVEDLEILGPARNQADRNGTINSPPMKTLRLLSVFLGLAAGALYASDSKSATSRINVSFDHPENFTDVKDRALPTDKGRDEILSNIRNFMMDQADRILPAGDSLRITFTDIDLAGDFEPQRGPQWDDVRVVKAIYPPAFNFSYTVTDASGKVLKEGTEHIRDMTFDTRITFDRGDPLHYEKDILDDWMRNTLRNIK
jgi:hypothetical protein